MTLNFGLRPFQLLDSQDGPYAERLGQRSRTS